MRFGTHPGARQDRFALRQHRWSLTPLAAAMSMAVFSMGAVHAQTVDAEKTEASKKSW